MWGGFIVMLGVLGILVVDFVVIMFYMDYFNYYFIKLEMEKVDDMMGKKGVFGEIYVDDVNDSMFLYVRYFVIV